MLKYFFRDGLLLALFCHITAVAQDHHVDFRYAPARHYSVIGFPYDWLKTVVTTRGGLGYDFGPGGPYAVPMTEISFGVQDTLLPVVRQYFDEARVPIAITEFGTGAVRLRQQAFALLTEGKEKSDSQYDDGIVRRLHGIPGACNWAAPVFEADPAFRNVAWGTNRPVQYRVRVAPGAHKTVALGICEGGKYKGARLMDLRVEGAPPQVIDPVVDDQKNLPYVFLFEGKDEDRDGELAIAVHAAPETRDPNVYLNVFWIFPERTALSAHALLRGELSQQAEVYFDCGSELEAHAPQPRLDVMTADFLGEDIVPIISVTTPRILSFDVKTGMLTADGLPYMLTQPAALAATNKNRQWLLQLPAGTRHAELLVIHGRKQRERIQTIPEVSRAQEQVRTWWLEQSGIPFGKIAVPDSGIQYVFDANLRNIYQVAEIVDGAPQFQPGPSVYRGLFLYDILFMGEPLAMLGDTATVRRSLETAFSFQQEDGHIRVLYPHQQLSETAMAIYTAVWFAELTHDKKWLARHYPNMRRAMHWLRSTRAQTLVDPNAKNYGLMTAGFLDGGVSGTISDYSSVLFAFIALEKAVAAAQWLGYRDDAAQWQRLLDDFTRSFRHAARRDLRRDALGNTYLPITVADTSTMTPPQRGQWGFLVPLRYGRCFQAHGTFLDTLITMNLAMLQASLKEGMVRDTGWLKNGVWSWFGNMHALTWVWRGDYDKAHDMMYAVVNHADPYGTWVEEQHTRDIGTATSGDISNAEASAYFVNLVVHLFVYEREDHVELLAGVPAHWYRPGATIALREALTRFGSLSVRANITEDGATGTLHVESQRAPGTKSDIVLHMSSLQAQGYRDANSKPLPATLRIPWNEPYRLAFKK